MAYKKTPTKKAAKKVAKKKPAKASVAEKAVVTLAEPSKPVKTPSEGKKRYKARPKVISPADPRKVAGSYAKSKPSKRHPNIIG
jgi:hypothetical protein